MVLGSGTQLLVRHRDVFYSAKKRRLHHGLGCFSVQWNNGPQFQTVDVLPEAIYITEQKSHQTHSHQACDQQEHGEYSVLRCVWTILVLILGFRCLRSSASDQLVNRNKQITFERDAVNNNK